MGNSYFQFKQFTIRQDSTAMKVGTDGVLLGAWADVENRQNILDIGTGTGLIALMAAQRNSRAQIDAVEIEPEAARQAIENVSNSPWKERISVHSVPISQFAPPTTYDCILCNPPFFINSTRTPDPGRTIARHCDTLPHHLLLDNAIRLMTQEGCLQVILPPAEANLFINAAHQRHLSLLHITHVLPNPGKAPKRCLLQFSPLSLPTRTDELIIELSRHDYSEEYIRLTRDFYLNF